MATTYEATSYKRPAVVAQGFPGVIDVTYEQDLEDLTSDASYAFIINDVIKFFKLPANAVLLYSRLETDVLDDHATPTLVLDVLVTDGTTTKVMYEAASTLSSAGGEIHDSRTSLNAPADGTEGPREDVVGFITTNNDFYVAVKATTAAAGDAAADAKIKLSFGYTMQIVR